MAQVDFTLEEFATFARGWIGEPEGFDTELREIYDLMLEATSRSAIEALRAANEFLEGMDLQALFVFEGRLVFDPWDSVHVLEYINAGDTYAGTLLYDVQGRTFFLGTYGDFVERWEAENQPPQQCAECGVMVRPEELADDLCEDCQPEPIPTWTPSENDALVAVLRSAEGFEVSVHAMNGDATNLAFSVPVGTRGEFYAHRPHDPYAMTLAELLERFEHNDDTLVTLIGEDNVVITRDQFERLRVALDAFVEAGGAQPIKDLLKTPAVLWSCSELDVHWYEERGEATIQVFTGQNTEHVREGNDPLEIWSARSPEVEELIEDGFIKWKNDKTLLEYLNERGLCRR